MAATATASPNISGHAEKVLLDETIKLERS
jgi:hypothetical protein